MDTKSSTAVRLFSTATYRPTGMRACLHASPSLLRPSKNDRAVVPSTGGNPAATLQPAPGTEQPAAGALQMQPGPRVSEAQDQTDPTRRGLACYCV